MQLFEKNGRFSKTAFWFSLFMGLALAFSGAFGLRVVLLPDREFVEAAGSAMGLLGGLSTLAGLLYSWGKKIDLQN